MEKFNIEISEYVHSEIDDAREFYNLQKNGLGDDFKYDVFMAITNIAIFPTLYPNINTNVKRCLLHRFPYSIFYAIREQSVVILSVAHQHRKPRYF